MVTRLGLAREAQGDDQTYRAALAVLEEALPADCAARIRAHDLLRRHGQELCKNDRPRCDDCPLAERCPPAG